MVTALPPDETASAPASEGGERPAVATAQMLEAAEAKAVQADKDLQEKRRPYEADPLFMYLWRRRFGTPEYRGKGLARYLDRRVATLIAFDGARRNYAVLIELPTRLQEHAERLRAELSSRRDPDPHN
jgi:hypothetical protein